MITVTHNFDQLRNQLSALERDQLPYATARALTNTALAAKAALRQEMVRVFDRPTPFTLNSLFVTPASKRKLEAVVLAKDLDNKGGGSARLRTAPQIRGGQRDWKRFEGALRRAGLLGNDEQAVPGQAATLDAYGNMSRGQIVQILAWFQAFAESGYKANTTAAGRKKAAAGTRRRQGYRYFYKRDGKGRGIYKATRFATGSAIQPVLMFVRRAQYRPRLDMAGVVNQVAATQFESWFRDAMAEAMRFGR
jgi:hypothetical protein